MKIDAIRFYKPETSISAAGKPAAIAPLIHQTTSTKGRVDPAPMRWLLRPAKGAAEMYFIIYNVVQQRYGMCRIKINVM